MLKSHTRNMKTPTKRKSPTRAQLIKKADKYFSLAIRYRDAEKRPDGWWVQCITCSKWIPLKQCHAGHFMSRRYYATRWDDENVNGQCAGCNTFRYGEQYKYGVAIDLKYGAGTAARLARQSQEIRRITSYELLEIIKEAKEQIMFYEKGV
jgi:hypothetical protein